MDASGEDAYNDKLRTGIVIVESCWRGMELTKFKIYGTPLMKWEKMNRN